MILKKIKDYDYIFIAITTIILFFFPILFSGKTFFFRDIHRFFYPMKYFLATSLKAGSIPFWCPNYFCGSPFMSDIQSGVFYPISLLFLVFPFPHSFNIYIILHFFLAFFFFYHFIKEIGLSRKSALFTGISYCYGSYTISVISTISNLSTLIWLPAMLWSFHRATTKNFKSGYFLTVLFLCMAILGGEPQLFIMSAGLLFFHGLLSSSGKSFKLDGFLKNAVIILILILSAVLITLAQLGPTYLDYQYSVRFGGLAYNETTRFSMTWAMLKHLILPLKYHAGFTTDPDILRNFFPGNAEMPWLLTIYPGFLIVPITLLGLYYNFSKKILFWLATFFIFLILALGPNTPIHYIFYKIFPFFRFPEKFMFLAGFSLLVMCAYGLDFLISSIEKKGLRSDIFFILLFVILFVDLYINHKHLNPVWESKSYQYHHQHLQPVLDDPQTFRVYVDLKTDALPSTKKTILNHHIKWQMMLKPNLGILHDLNHVGGKTGLELIYQYFITEILLRPWAEKIHFLKLANVKYIVSSQKLDKIPGLAGKVEKINSLVYRIKDHLPRAFLVGQLHLIKNGTVDKLINPTFDLSTSALTKGEIAHRYNMPFKKEINHISYEKDGSIHIELTTDRAGILFLSESSYHGWRVFVDGKEEDCLWLNLLFQGVEVEKGRHQIDFIFRPKHFSIFLVISLSSLAIFFPCWFCHWLFVIKRGLP